jgi:hypothetical protein
MPYEDIGKLAVAFGDLEVVTHVLAWNPIGRAPQAPAVTEGLSIGEVGQLLKRITDSQAGAAIGGERRARISEICIDLELLDRARKEIMHGFWSAADIEGIGFGVVWTHIEVFYPGQEPKRVRASDVARLSEAVRELFDRISLLDLELMESPDPAPGT